MIMRYKFFSIRNEAGVTTVTLSPDLGKCLVADELMLELGKAIDEVRPAKLVVDFAGVETCPSAVIAALLTTRRKLQSCGGRMKLSIPLEGIRVVFRRLNLNQMFEIYPSRVEAIFDYRESRKSH